MIREEKLAKLASINVIVANSVVTHGWYALRTQFKFRHKDI